MVDNLPASGVIAAARAARPDHAHPELFVPRSHSLTVRSQAVVAAEPAHLPVTDDVPGQRAWLDRHRAGANREDLDSCRENQEQRLHVCHPNTRLRGMR